MTKITGSLLFIFLLGIANDLMAQKVSVTRPALQQPAPDFIFNDIHYWNKNVATLQDFQGKWLILDAWALGCVSCIASFPHLNELLSKIKDRATLLLVGQEHPLIREWYEKYRAMEKLELPVAYDSIFFKNYGITTVPHVFIIDPNGIVRAITGSDDLTFENLQSLFSGKGNNFSRKYYADEKIDNDESRPYFIHNNAGMDDDYLFRSVLTKWNNKQTTFTSTFNKAYNWSEYNKNGIQLLGQTIKDLYFLAFLGKSYISSTDSLYYTEYWRYPILEMKDTSHFTADYSKELNVYNYSLLVPDSEATNNRVQQLMQKDLEGYFGYSASIEEREMPVWIALPGKNFDRLKTKGGPRVNINGAAIAKDYRVSNTPVRRILNRIMEFNQKEPWPLFDKTNSTAPIDIELDCTIDNFTSVRSELKKKGIDIVPSVRKMKVLVLRDINYTTRGN